MKMRKNGLWIIIVTKQYIINLHYHKVERTIVAQKILKFIIYCFVTIKSLPGYGNAELKKKEIKPYVKEKPFIKV